MPSKASDAAAQASSRESDGGVLAACRVIAWEPVPHFRAFLEYTVALNNFTALVEVRSLVVADKSGESYTLTVPQRGIWGTASVNGGNIDRRASCMHSRAALCGAWRGLVDGGGGSRLIWEWQSNALGCRIKCRWRLSCEIGLSLCLHGRGKRCVHVWTTWYLSILAMVLRFSLEV